MGSDIFYTLLLEEERADEQPDSYRDLMGLPQLPQVQRSYVGWTYDSERLMGPLEAS